MASSVACFLISSPEKYGFATLNFGTVLHLENIRPRSRKSNEIPTFKNSHVTPDEPLHLRSIDFPEQIGLCLARENPTEPILIECIERYSLMRRLPETAGNSRKLTSRGKCTETSISTSEKIRKKKIPTN